MGRRRPRLSIRVRLRLAGVRSLGLRQLRRGGLRLLLRLSGARALAACSTMPGPPPPSAAPPPPEPSGPERICFHWRDFGRCRFGKKCMYLHAGLGGMRGARRGTQVNAGSSSGASAAAPAAVGASLAPVPGSTGVPDYPFLVRNPPEGGFVKEKVDSHEPFQAYPMRRRFRPAEQATSGTGKVVAVIHTGGVSRGESQLTRVSAE